MAGWTPIVIPNRTNANLDQKTQRVQARFVQHQFVRSELRHLDGKAGEFKQETMKELQKTVPALRNVDWNVLLAAFDQITARLQSADLTINIKASSWFMTPNNYDSYTQMYERAVRTINVPGQAPMQEMRLKNTPGNDAATRSAVDNQVTFRSEFKQNDGSFKPGYSGLGRVMDTGGLVAPTVDAQPGEWVAQNPHFNPQSKQVFAALNYGRRLHGSCTFYGRSFMTLNPKFKAKALYFSGDTFGVQYRLHVGSDDHIPYEYLGAVYARANPLLQTALRDACWKNMTLADTGEAMHLVEAHLFEPLYFPGNIQAIYISAKDKVDGAMTGDHWSTMQTNARTFAAKHGAQIYFVE
jgi:hypothetical protein